MMRPSTRYARSGDLHIAYQVIGDGPIDLLYAQGWVSHLEYAWESPDYARLMTKYGRFSRFIRFDKRGTGLSDRDIAGAATLDQRADDIRAVLDAVGSQRAALLGTSEGGYLCCAMAATYPERISHLILMGCHARATWAPDYPWTPKREDAERDLVTMMAGWGGPVDLDMAAPSMKDDAAAREWWGAYLRNAASPRSLEAHTRLSWDFDVRDILSSIRVPTLVLHREGDRWCHVDEARYLAAHIPDAVLRILPGEDHLQFYGDQDALVSEVRAFVTGTRAPLHTERVLLTLLALDVADSTGQATAIGDDAWRGRLDALREKVARAVADHEGAMIDEAGDGFLAGFAGPTRAVECARALLRSLGPLGVTLRTGVHTSECERSGGRVRGQGVHLVHRIMAEAAPGEILTSSTVRDLSAGSGVVFETVGERVLKGFEAPRPLFAVR